MQNPSEEQLAIIQAVGNGTNVIGEAVAGSGKTTTVLSIAAAFPNKTVLQITYNKALRAEVYAKVVKFDLLNCRVFTYHGLATCFYDLAKNDIGLREIVDADQLPTGNPTCPDILVIDEAQDMTSLYHSFVLKFMRDVEFRGVLLVLGDRYQCVYAFKQSDPRFLTLADRLHKRESLRLTLRTSYRLTRQIAAFVNEVMLGEDRITAVRDGPPVFYIRGKTDAVKRIMSLIGKELESGELKPEDIFVLAPSIKKSEKKGKRKPHAILENFLAHKNIPIHAPTNDDSEVKDEVICGKIVFSSFHQAKGRERRVVIIYGFDKSYFTYYNKDEPEDICTCAMYVAATRASQLLIVVEGQYNEPLPFLKKSLSEMSRLPYIIMSSLEPTCIRRQELPPRKYSTSSVTNLVRFLSEQFESSITNIVDKLFVVVHPIKNIVEIPCTARFGKSVEIVSDINGIVIPSIYEQLTTGKCVMTNYVIAATTGRKVDKMITRTLKPCGNLLDVPKQPGKTACMSYLRIGNVYLSLREELLHKLGQIKNYKWLSPADIGSLMKNMSHVGTKATYEEEVSREYNTPESRGPFIVLGRLDALDRENGIVWEFKCVGELSLEHKLQLLVYASIMQPTTNNLKFRLMNIRTEEILELDMSDPSLVEDIVCKLIAEKRTKKSPLSDDEFVAQN